MMNWRRGCAEKGEALKVESGECIGAPVFVSAPGFWRTGCDRRDWCRILYYRRRPMPRRELAVKCDRNREKEFVARGGGTAGEGGKFRGRVGGCCIGEWCKKRVQNVAWPGRLRRESGGWKVERRRRSVRRASYFLKSVAPWGAGGCAERARGPDSRSARLCRGCGFRGYTPVGRRVMPVRGVRSCGAAGYADVWQ